MRIHKPTLILLVILEVICLPAVHGENATAFGLVAPNEKLQNTQYMPIVSAPSAHISAPVQINILGKTLTTQYLGTTTGGYNLWIQEIPGWTQYIEVPQGATVSLIAVSPAGGNGYLSEIHNGTRYSSNFYFYRNSQLTFYADRIGQHSLSFAINGQSSNLAVINVIAYVPPQNYFTPKNYYLQNYYYPVRNYPYFEFGRHWPRFWGGRNWSHVDYPWLNPP